MSKKMILIGLVACSALRVDNVEASEVWRRGESVPRARASSTSSTSSIPLFVSVGDSGADLETQPEAPVAQPSQQEGSDTSQKLDGVWREAGSIVWKTQQYGRTHAQFSLAPGVFVCLKS